jgi:hypothetical protein
MIAGCSWLPLSYPCVAINVSAWIVSDENTVLVAGADPVNGTIFRTTSAGSQPWDEFVARNCDNALASDGIDFDLAAPMTDDSAVLFGDDNGQVFFSNNLGATWHEVRDVVTGKFDAGNGNTYVAFDPGYYDATDAGYHTFYAAASDDVGRCTLADPTAVSLCKSDWLSLVNDICCEDMTLAEASGIEAVGDTTLYVADAGSGLGVWRTVNPLDVVTEVPPLNLVEWSELDATLVAQNFEHPMDSDDLWVTQGSNDLWCLESDDANFIYMWSDPLAAQVALVSPTNGQLLTTTTTVTLQWAALDNATCYEVALYIACPECLSTFGMLPVDISDLGCKAAAVPCAMCSGANNAVVCGQTCLPVAGLTAGTKYYWKVRVACESPVVSKWSDLYYFNTALDVTDFLCSPRCGADGIILNTNFSWDVVLGATSYELQIVAASADGTADFTGATTLTSNVNALASIPGLQYSTVYFWRVRAVNDGVAGAWATCLFTTMDEPEACPEPITPVTIVTEEVTPVWIWVIIGIGGALTIVVIILIVTTRKAS